MLPYRAVPEHRQNVLYDRYLSNLADEACDDDLKAAMLDVMQHAMQSCFYRECQQAGLYHKSMLVSIRNWTVI